MAINEENNSINNGTNRNGFSGKLNGEFHQNGKGRADGPDADEIDLKQLFYTLWNHKWIIAGSVLVCTVLAGIAAYTVTPIYRSEGSLLISETSGPSALGGNDMLGSMLSSTYGLGMGSTVSNELQILRSRKLATEIADSLLRLRLMKNGRQFPVLFTNYPDDSTVVGRDTVATRLRKRLVFSQVDREADLIQVAYESPSPLEAAFIVNASMDIYSQMSTRHTRMTASSAVAFLQKERKQIEERLLATEERLREFMNENQLIQVDAQTEELISQMATLEAARQEARVKLVAINTAIDQYNEKLNNIKPGLADQYADAIGPNMARLQYQLAEHQIEKIRLLANNPELKDSPNPPKMLVELNQKIQLYKDQIRSLTQDLLKQSDQYLGFLGGGESIAQAVTEINQRLIELQVEQQQYKAQMDLLNQQLNEQQRFFESLPDNMIELARLKRDVAISEELYLTVSKQYAEMALWEQTQFGLARPVDSGYVPKIPVEPNKVLYVLVGFILGGILGVGYVFVREAFNSTIDSAEKLKALPYPLLSVIPILNDDRFRTNLTPDETVPIQGQQVSDKLVSLIDTISPAAESFRRLQNNIIYSRPGHPPKTILITSSTKGEGKSTICANLAVSLSEMGKRVIVVDLDLRRPTTFKLFGLRQSPGIFDILFENASAENVVQQTAAPGVDLLASGKRPPNPAAVLQSKALSELIKQLQQEYDHVLIDTPPFGIITDAASLINMTDGVVVVARFKETDQTQLAHTLESLSSIHANILGLALTAFDHQKSNDTYNMQYYRYTYQDYMSYAKGKN